jgi:hypothetical protein
MSEEEGAVIVVTTKINPKCDVTVPVEFAPVWSTRPIYGVSMVSTLTDGSDDTYLYTDAVVNTIADFTLENKPISRPINDVRMHVRGSIHHGVHQVIISFLLDGVVWGDGIILDTTPSEKSYAWGATNPVTGLPWAPNELNTMQLRLLGNASAPQADLIPISIHELWIEVDHDQHPGPAVVLIRDYPPDIR